MTNLFHGLLGLMTGLFMASAPSVAASEDTYMNVDRIVAFGDMHGDYGKFTALLKQAALVDDDLHWTGGETHFVQLGDILDRGPDSRKIADLLMALETEAKREGGRVHFVIGNHEAMDMTGDTRYVHPGEYAAFVSEDSQAKQDRAWRDHVTWVKRNVAEKERPVFDDAYEAKWREDHPLGWLEFRVAWGPRGTYGKWLLKHKAVVRINDLLFVHGGIGPKYVDASRQWMNDEVHDAMATGVYDPDSILYDEEGPLWYRGLAWGSEVDLSEHVEALLATQGVAHVVIAHTPLTGAIYPRFDGKVVLIDVGLGAYYGGRQAYLLAEGGSLTAVHRGHPLPLPMAGGMDRINYLKEAAALDPDPSPIQKRIDALMAEEADQ